MVAPVFAAEAMWKSFGPRPILRDASAWAFPGSVTVLLGRNGCGKSTLLRCAMGYLRTFAGVVIFRDARYDRPSLARLSADGLFYLADRRLLARGLTLRQHLSALQSRFPGAAAEAALDLYRTTPFQDRRPHELSGGEERRAELTVAAARGPACLIADEPFRGLAPIDAEVVSSGLRALAERGTAVLITGHEVRQLLALGDHIIWMTGGTTHYLGTPAEALEHRLFRWDYLTTTF
jgi:ABC-type multidrug transport system ATPase subunit